MKKNPGYLDELAAEYGVFISGLRLNTQLRKAAPRRLQGMIVPAEHRLDLQQAMEYLTEGGVPYVG